MYNCVKIHGSGKLHNVPIRKTFNTGSNTKNVAMTPTYLILYRAYQSGHNNYLTESPPDTLTLIPFRGAHFHRPFSLSALATAPD